MQPAGTPEKKGPLLNGGIVSPFFSPQCLIPPTLTHTRTHALAPISALSYLLACIVLHADDKMCDSYLEHRRSCHLSR